MATAEELYEDLVSEHLARPGVRMGRMFNSEGLQVRGRVYAFYARSRGRVVVKLPAPRAAALVEDGTAEEMRMGGRRMREWVGLAQPDEEIWRHLLGEAAAYGEELAG
ncbi:hypothetical protein AB0K18_24660 [Nonomuraea sp. NPDC049421]|uniref:hypothetical protein n=1 Tax=Nonomuraea sp. NPDC049421 TaxID=3155275 RepID=UPI00342BD725